MTELEIELQNKVNAYAMLFGQVRAALTSTVSDTDKVRNIKECFLEHETRERQRRNKLTND